MGDVATRVLDGLSESEWRRSSGVRARARRPFPGRAMKMAPGPGPCNAGALDRGAGAPATSAPATPRTPPPCDRAVQLTCALPPLDPRAVIWPMALTEAHIARRPLVALHIGRHPLET